MEAYPAAPRRRPVERLRRAVALVESRGRRLLVRRSGALLDGLWEPPGVDLEPGLSARRALSARLRELGLRVILEPTGRVVRHVITHRAIEVEVWHGEGAGRLAAGAAWHGEGTRERPLTALARRLLAAKGETRKRTRRTVDRVPRGM